MIVATSILLVADEARFAGCLATAASKMLAARHRSPSVTTITIPLSDESYERLRARAEKDGLSSDEFLRRHVEELLQRDDEFQRAAAYVLKKNAELYRRLA